MKPRICICCGEPLGETSHALSRNPNVCPSCSSLADGMEESNLPQAQELGSANALSRPALDPIDKPLGQV